MCTYLSSLPVLCGSGIKVQGAHLRAIFARAARPAYGVHDGRGGRGAAHSCRVLQQRLRGGVCAGGAVGWDVHWLRAALKRHRQAAVLPRNKPSVGWSAWTAVERCFMGHNRVLITESSRRRQLQSRCMQGCTA